MLLYSLLKIVAGTLSRHYHHNMGSIRKNRSSFSVEEAFYIKQVQLYQVEEMYEMARSIGDTAYKAIQQINTFLTKHTQCKCAKSTETVYRVAMKKVKLQKLLRRQTNKIENLSLSYKALTDEFEEIRAQL